MQTFRIRYADQIVSAFLFLVLLVVGVVLFMVIRSQDLFVKRIQYYTIFAEGSGLKPETPVRLAGIEVGKIRAVSLTEDDKVRVGFEVIEQYTDRIVSDPEDLDCEKTEELRRRCGTRVKTSGSLGFGAIIPGGGGLELVVGDRRNPPVTPGGYVKSETEEGLLERLEREGVIENLRETVAQVSLLLARINDEQGPVWQSVKNVEAVTAKASSGQGLLGELLTSGSPLYRRVDGSLGSLQDSMAKVNASAANIQDVTGGVQAKLEKVQAVIDNLETFSRDLTETGQRLKQFAAEAEHVPPDLRIAIKNLDGRIDDLGQIINGLKRSLPFSMVVEEKPR